MHSEYRRLGWPQVLRRGKLPESLAEVGLSLAVDRSVMEQRAVRDSRQKSSKNEHRQGMTGPQPSFRDDLCKFGTLEHF